MRGDRPWGKPKFLGQLDGQSKVGNRKSAIESRQSKVGNQKSAIKKSAIGNTMDSLTYTQLLSRKRSFRRVWVGQLISELGNWFNFIAALGLVRQVAHAAPEATTIVLLSRLIPFTVFGPLAGAFVDRWSRRTVMIAT